MPRPKKVQAKATSRAKIDSARASGYGGSQPITPLADATNRPRDPPRTPLAIDFTLALPETGDDRDDRDDGWSSDDSFEEKITWSRHRVRVIPGGFTPRNIQEVRRRLNLAELPEDKPSPTNVKPIPRKSESSCSRPKTPIKTFQSRDPNVLPPTPSPKKPVAVTRGQQAPVHDTPSMKAREKPVDEESKEPVRLAAQGDSKGNPPASPLRNQITQVKEFKFASDARSRGSSIKQMRRQKEEAKEKAVPSDVAKPILGKDKVEAEVGAGGQSDKTVGVKIDDGLAIRMKAHEAGKASIVAWGEARGRHVDD